MATPPCKGLQAPTDATAVPPDSQVIFVSNLRPDAKGTANGRRSTGERRQARHPRSTGTGTQKSTRKLGAVRPSERLCHMLSKAGRSEGRRQARTAARRRVVGRGLRNQRRLRPTHVELASPGTASDISC